MRWPVRLRDERLEHQLVIEIVQGYKLAVTCNCCRPVPIEVRNRWEPWQALSAWRKWHRAAELD